MNAVSSPQAAPAQASAHAALNEWVAEVAALTRPDAIHWCDGSDAEYQALLQQMQADGTLLPLNQDTHPGCWLHRSDPDDVARQNPMSHIGKVRTPTLVIHSEEDWRCPIEQGQRWFVGLKRQGVPTEFLVFSGEGHELSRSGTPKHRVARFEYILDWWKKYLPVT